MRDVAIDLLSRRKADASGEFVFPGGGRSGYIYEPRKYINTITEATKSPLPCTTCGEPSLPLQKVSTFQRMPSTFFESQDE